MTNTILAFGIVKEIIGSSSLEWTFEEGMCVDEIKAGLVHTYPGLWKLTSFMIAINNEYATADTVVKQGDQIAIIPPVSGG